MDESLAKHVQGFAVLFFHWSGTHQMWLSPKTLGHVTDHVVDETAVSILFVSKFSRLYGPPVIPWSNQQNWLTALMSSKQKRPFTYLHREWPVEWPAIVTVCYVAKRRVLTKKLSVEGNRKWPMANRMVMWPMTLRDLKGQDHDSNTLRAQYLENSWRCYAI